MTMMPKRYLRALFIICTITKLYAPTKFSLLCETVCVADGYPKAAEVLDPPY